MGENVYYYSKNSKRKIIHTENCFLRKKLDPKSVGTFDTLYEAFKSGYRLCRRCNPIFMQYTKERDALMDYCYKNAMSCHYSDRYLVITSTLSKWIISLSDRNETVLYHKNTKSLDSDSLSKVPGYHIQRVSYKTLIEYFDYITEHDFYRNRHPERMPSKKKKSPPKKGTKRWRKEQARLKARERRQAINSVLSVIDSLNGNYSPCVSV